MKLKNIENRLAVVGALIVLVGVTFAAQDALVGNVGLDIAGIDHSYTLAGGER